MLFRATFAPKPPPPPITINPHTAYTDLVCPSPIQSASQEATSLDGTSIDNEEDKHPEMTNILF